MSALCTCTGKTCRFLFSWVWNISNLFFVQEFKVRKTIKNKQKLCWWIRVYTGLNKPRINGRKLLNCKVAVKRCAQADRTKRNLDLYSWRPRLQCAAEIRKHRLNLRIRSFWNSKLLENAMENVLQTGGIWKRRFCVSAWTEHFEFIETDEFMITMWIRWPNLPRTQIQNDQWLLRPAKRGRGIIHHDWFALHEKYDKLQPPTKIVGKADWWTPWLQQDLNRSHL